ncbi:deoxyribonuclease V [Desulfonema ishimotonii]|uniref:Endonuclease V n=1 Tax=Desulfonema ishimotonii TaxID=45657 RepID=A0A401G1U7_9BACT|nr:deoxyribonuclease V [Desulfonema ishimotonii]GBC63218.1 deoxyribonuclease V [Desulfonema ishimotonii]
MAPPSHPWNLSPSEAIALQKELAARVICRGTPENVKTVAGVDVSFGGEMARAAAVVLGFPDLEVTDHAVVTRPVTFPYIPGLFTFREGPVAVAAIEQLAKRPDLIIFDGQGLAHPRRLGIASHMGLLLDLPTIGCAKTRLCGTFDPPGPEKGSWSPLIHRGEVIGAAVRTRTNVRPVFVSPGHLLDLPSAIRFVLACCRKYRLPETTRQADHVAGGGGIRDPSAGPRTPSGRPRP